MLGVLSRFDRLAGWGVLACAMAFALGGCATQPPKNVSAASRPPDLNLPPDSLGRRLSLSQIVTGTFDNQTRSMRFEIEIDNNVLVIAGLSHFGATLFVLRQEGEQITAEAYSDNLYGIDPSWMLFDLKVTYWPAGRLGLALSQRQMRLEDVPDNGLRRVYGPGERLVMEVHYLDGFLTPGQISITHFDRPYRLFINAIEPGKNS